MSLVHFKAHGPTLVNVSGGRTSAFLLRLFLDANEGLPTDSRAVFCNTGKEHEATLAFLREIESRWCPIVWLEYRPSDATKFAVVDYCSASRNGEPFSALIESRKMLPNPVTRFCTSDLKIRTGNRYAKSLGWESFDRLVGLRADEPRRVARMRGDTKNENVRMPLASAGLTIDDVRRFWRSQDFDLALPGDDNSFGNCDLCFLKARSRIEKVVMSDPSRADWWAEQEEKVGATFRKDRATYRQIKAQLSVQGRLLDDTIVDETHDCFCGD